MCPTVHTCTCTRMCITLHNKQYTNTYNRFKLLWYKLWTLVLLLVTRQWQSNPPTHPSRGWSLPPLTLTSLSFLNFLRSFSINSRSLLLRNISSSTFPSSKYKVYQWLMLYLHLCTLCIYYNVTCHVYCNKYMYIVYNDVHTCTCSIIYLVG